MKVRILILFSLLTSLSIHTSAQQKTNAEKTDSIVAVLPRLSDEEKLNALLTLTNLTFGLPEQKHYTFMYLNEARKQKNIRAESSALLKLTLLYYLQFDSDSIFIIGEEAVRFARQHKQYDDLFFAMSELIRRHKAQGHLLTALRKAEEAYAEAKELKEDRFMARMLSTRGEILYNMEQYEEAVKHWIESIELAAPYRNAQNELFILQHYDLLAITFAILNRHQESLNYADSIQNELARLERDKPDLNLQRFHFYMEYHRAMAYSGMKQPARALEAIRRAEAVYDPRWNERNPAFAAQIDNLYAEYYRALGNYDKALELFNRILRFDEQANREASVVQWKKLIAQVNREKGDYKTSAEFYEEVLKKKEELNNEQYFAQLNELRTIYELDKAEMESARRLAEIRQQRLVITGLAFACIALALIVGLTVWSRKKIAEKNRGLYRQIKEQDKLRQDVETLRATSLQGATSVQHATSEQYNGDSQQRQLVSRLRDYLLQDKNFTKPDIYRDELVSELITNKTYLFESVKAVTGKTLQEYINSMRLEEAKRLLESEFDLPIQTILESCGFNSRSTFYRLFDEKYNISPREYRRVSWQVKGDG